MEKLKNYKTILLVILVIILFLFIWFGILPYFKTEAFSDTESITMMNALVGKNVYLACDVAGEKRYLTVLPKQLCSSINPTVQDCKTNVAILQSAKSEYSLFEIGKHPDLSKYTIRSQNKDIGLPTLSHHLLNTDINKLCFSTDTSDDIYFETELTDSGVLFKFNGNLYVGLCVKDNFKCGNDIRVCLFQEKQLATPFRFEMTTPKKLENFDNSLGLVNSTPIKLENFDNFDNITSLPNLSMYSESFYSNDTLMSSIPGAGCIGCDYQSL